MALLHFIYRSKKIKKLMKQKKLTINKLSVLSGIDSHLLKQLFENENSHIHIDTLMNVSRALDVTPESIIKEVR